jgi:TolB protein
VNVLVNAAAVFVISGAPQQFAPGIVSTAHSDARLTISPDGRTALWFTRNRPGGPGGYDIWISRRIRGDWNAAQPVDFNSSSRDFDPAFSSDGRWVYFSSDRPGGLGGDDIYRVEVTRGGFGTPQNVGSGVNSSGNEWAPMLSADGKTLLFSSNGRGGAGRMDLFTALRATGGFRAAVPLAGAINTAADEFDGTFLARNSSVIFSRANDLRVDHVDLYYASRDVHGYDGGAKLPDQVNVAGESTYAPMLDWSRRGRLTFTGKRTEANSGAADVYVVNYRLRRH